uniref:Abhydrolase_3 domain-containing protein n=1 Tax=Parastrongyloides trichosuri TaxID=131310 RepID=A0A0N4Z143_PARTI
MDYVIFDIIIFVLTICVVILPKFHIPLPEEIGDKPIIHVFELSLRIFNEYLGTIVAYFWGHEGRVWLARILTKMAFIIKPPCPRWLSISNIKISGIECRLYQPNGKYRKNDHAIIFIAGGGWCFLEPSFYDQVLYGIIKRLGCMVISINYSKAPEKVFPCAVNECDSVVEEFCSKKYKEYNIDPTKITIMGDSAGGNLATVVAQKAMRRGHRYFKCQVLIYPLTSCLDFKSPSYQKYYNEYIHTAILHPMAMARGILLYTGCPTTEENAYRILRNQHVPNEIRYSDNYVASLEHNNLPLELLPKNSYAKPKQYKEDEDLSKIFEKFATNPDFAPLVAEDLENMPNTFIGTCGYDILRDDGILYGKKLERFGIPVVNKYYPKGIHGTFNMTFSASQKEMINDICEYIEEQMK